MPSYSDISTLVTGAGTLTFGAASPPTYFVDPGKCSGLIGTGEIRNPVDDRGQTSGFLLHDFFERGARGVIGGHLHAHTVADRNTLMANMKAALRSILTTTGTLNFTGGATLAVQFELGCDFDHIDGIAYGFRFGLVAAAAL